MLTKLKIFTNQLNRGWSGVEGYIRAQAHDRVDDQGVGHTYWKIYRQCEIRVWWHVRESIKWETEQQF